MFLKINLTKEKSKERKLKEICRKIDNRVECNECFWVPIHHKQNFKNLKQVKQFENKSRKGLFKLWEIADVKQGLATGYKDRFTRLAPELEGLESRIGKEWFIYAKGAGYSPYFRRVAIFVEWKNDGESIRSYRKGGRIASRVQNERYYQQYGLSYSRVRSRFFSSMIINKLFIIGANGPGIFMKGESKKGLYTLLAITNSPIFTEYVRPYVFANWEVGAVGDIMLPEKVRELIKNEKLSELSYECENIIKKLHSGPLSFPARVSDVHSFLKEGGT